MAGVEWPPEEVAFLVECAIAERGKPFLVIPRHRARYAFRSDSAVRIKLRHLSVTRPDVRPQSDDEAAVQRWTEMRDQSIREVATQKPVISIVDLPPIESLPVKYKPNPCYVVSSDHHWPLQDDRAESIVLQAIKALRPRGYILNGDGPDMLALSKYPKDMRKGRSWELNEEQLHAKNWWRRVHSLGQEWGMELYETEANHSGNNQASRFRRWLNENCGMLYQLDGFEDLMRYERFFHPIDVPVQMVEEVVIAADLRIRHGEIVRKHGGYSARAHGDKWQASILHGHTHRVGSSIKRRPGIPGVRGDEFLRTYEIGCMCKLDLDYAPGADWCQGFAVVYVDDATGSYNVEPIPITDGRATSAALRGTLAA